MQSQRIATFFLHGLFARTGRERKEEKSKPTVQKDQYAATDSSSSSSKSPVNEKRAQKDEIANKCTATVHTARTYVSSCV